MERLPVSRRTPTLAAALLLSTNLVTADAALLAHFDFEDANGGFTLAGKDLALNFSTGLWRDADGTSKKGTGNPGFALSTTSFHDGNRLLLTLAPASGFDLRLRYRLRTARIVDRPHCLASEPGRQSDRERQYRGQLQGRAHRTEFSIRQWTARTRPQRERGSSYGGHAAPG